MSYEFNLFYRNKQQVNLGFSGEEISSDGGVIILEKIERETGLIKNFCKLITDHRHQSYVAHTIYQIIKQRIYLLVQGYEDAIDEKHLRNDPVILETLENSLASQPTISRMENGITEAVIDALEGYFIDRYVNSLPKDKKEIIIDTDSTDAQTYGKQQYSMFNDFYKEYMYHPLFFHDGETGQLILAVLRPGNVHTSRGFVDILRRIIDKVREKRPNIKITIRGDSGFSGAEFYKFAKEKNLNFCIGISGNKVLQEMVKEEEECVKQWFYEHGEDYQYFTGAMEYKAGSWEYPQKVYAKIECTKNGMNKRFICSNLCGKTMKELYIGFYVKRGDRSENRIKELKTMCFSGRMSCSKFNANYFRLMLSSLCYEMFRLIKLRIRKTGNKEASKWQVSSIRLYLLKVGATVKRRVRSLTIEFSKSYVCQKLLIEMLS